MVTNVVNPSNTEKVQTLITNKKDSNNNKYHPMINLTTGEL